MTREEIKERVREAADIVQIIGESVPLRRAGATFRGPCPFHNGKDRNFSVSPKLGLYKCFVCHESGDVFSFLQKRLGMDFPSALRAVAEKSGVELPRHDGRDTAPDPREPGWETLAAAAEHFSRVLWDDPAGEPARAYLASRQVDRATADRFGLGYAADGDRALTYLRGLGLTDDRLTDAGVLTAPEDGRKPGARFWHRLMFPIFDAGGHIVGFGGRALGTAKPKYLNSPDSPIFSKSKLLYGLHWAKLGMRREGQAILVEGYFDLLRVVAAGIETAVASMGTALTEAQARLLARYTKHVFIAYDSDQPGLRATFRSADALLEQGVRVRVVTLPPGDDPDSYVAARGKAAFESELGQALDVFDRKVQFLERGGWFADLDHKRRAIDKLLPTIRVTSDPITQQLYVGRLSEASGVSAETLWREVGDGPEPLADVADPPVQRVTFGAALVEPIGVEVLAERMLVQSVLAARSLVESVAARIDVSDLRDARCQAIFVALRAQPDATLEELAAGLSPDDVALVQEMQAEGAGAGEVARVVEDCIRDLKVRRLKERLVQIDHTFGLADDATKNELMMEKSRLTRAIGALNGRVFSMFGKSIQRRRGAP